MGSVRRYQLAHPEEVTEVMNRLAQALLCLADPRAKAAYDAQLQSAQTRAALASELLPPSQGREETGEPFGPPASAGAQAPVLPMGGVEQDWLASPPPRRRIELTEESSTQDEVSAPSDISQGVGGDHPESNGAPLPQGEEIAGADTALPYGPPAGRTRFVTKSALYARIAQVRRLTLDWDQVGKYLSEPNRLLQRPAEATELIRHMHAVRELAEGTPHLIGQAGQPGYLVLALARQQMIVPTLQTLLLSQREALARDWKAGQDRLHQERHVLRGEVHEFRRRTKWKHGFRLMAASLLRNPGLVLVLLGWVALNLAFTDLQRHWDVQLVIFLGLAASRLAIWRYSVEPIRIAEPPLDQARPGRRKPARPRPQPHSSEN
jgi:hypothetical protein